jgi:hypothetical protein
VIGSDVLPASRRFSKVVLRVAGNQFLQDLQLGFVLLLDQRRQPDAGHRLGLGAGIARALHLLAEHPRGPFGRLLRRRPGLAGQARATGGAMEDVSVTPRPLTRL